MYVANELNKYVAYTNNDIEEFELLLNTKKHFNFEGCLSYIITQY